MKIKHRALALILSAIMVLTYMPALAFAGTNEGAGWTLTQNASEFRLLGDEEEEEYVDLVATVSLSNEELDYSDLEYSWYRNDEMLEDWTYFDEESTCQEAGVTGKYTCYVREVDKNNIEDSVTFYVRRWSVPEYKSYYIDSGESITLNAEPEGDITGAISYQWQKEIPETGNYVNIEGAKAATLSVSAKGDYQCIVTETVDEENSWEQYFGAYVDSDNDCDWWAEAKEEELALVSGTANLEVG